MRVLRSTLRELQWLRSQNLLAKALWNKLKFQGQVVKILLYSRLSYHVLKTKHRCPVLTITDITTDKCRPQRLATVTQDTQEKSALVRNCCEKLHSRTPITRTLKGNKKQFELAGPIEYSIFHVND